MNNRAKLLLRKTMNRNVRRHLSVQESQTRWSIWLVRICCSVGEEAVYEAIEVAGAYEVDAADEAAMLAENAERNG